MNSAQRLFFGLLASFLFTVGLSRAAHAAEKSLGVTVSVTKLGENPAANCTGPCHWGGNA